MFILNKDNKIYCETVKDILDTSYKLNKCKPTKIYAICSCINKKEATELYNHFVEPNNRRNTAPRSFTLLGEEFEFVEQDNAYYFNISVVYDKSLTRADNIVKITNEIFELGNTFRKIKKFLTTKTLDK